MKKEKPKNRLNRRQPARPIKQAPVRKISLAVLVSGRGSNLQAIIEAGKKPSYPARVAVVISDNPQAYALIRAEKARIPGVALERSRYPDRRSVETEIEKILAQYQVELICLAGYMRLLSPEFVARHRGRIMNIHPALLPSFPGLHVQQKTVDYGVRYSGCTVHFVDEGADTGPVVLQAIVPVRQDDTGDTLAARILKKEHKIYAQAIRLFAEGRLKIHGRRVRISGK